MKRSYRIRFTSQAEHPRRLFQDRHVPRTTYRRQTALKIMSMVAKAKPQGATCATGGTFPGGWFIEPTVIRDVSQSVEICNKKSLALSLRWPLSRT